MTPFCAVEATTLTVLPRRSCAVLASPEATALRRRLTAVRMVETWSRLRSRRFRACRARLSAEFVFAIEIEPLRGFADQENSRENTRLCCLSIAVPGAG